MQNGGGGSSALVACGNMGVMPYAPAQHGPLLFGQTLASRNIKVSQMHYNCCAIITLWPIDSTPDRDGVKAPLQAQENAAFKQPVWPHESLVSNLAFNENVYLAYRLRQPDPVCILSAYDKGARRSRLFRVREPFLLANGELFPRAFEELQSKAVDEYDDALVKDDRENDAHVAEQLKDLGFEDSEIAFPSSNGLNAQLVHEKLDVMQYMSKTELEVLSRDEKSHQRAFRKYAVTSMHIYNDLVATLRPGQSFDSKEATLDGAQPRRTFDEVRNVNWESEHERQKTIQVAEAAAKGEMFNGKIKGGAKSKKVKDDETGTAAGGKRTKKRVRHQ